MRLEMVLNELSLRNSADNEKIARELMSIFIKTISLAVNKGIFTLRTKNRIYDITIAPNYPISKWLNDSQVNREQRDFLLTLATQTPLLKEITDNTIQNKVELSDFKYKGEIVVELGIAYLLDNIAISFKSQEKWNKSYLELKFTTLDENDEIIDEQVKIIHASCVTHIKEHSNWIHNRIKSTINNGIELWNRKQELFPNLEFCNLVQKQLENILSGQLELRLVVKALFILQDGSKNWQASIFSLDQYAIEESGESKPTLEKYRKERTFICPDGRERLFERHVKLRLCNWRIHFYPENPGKVIIGYVGRHLPTVKYK